MFLEKFKLFKFAVKRAASDRKIAEDFAVAVSHDITSYVPRFVIIEGVSLDIGDKIFVTVILEIIYLTQEIITVIYPYDRK